MIPATLLTMVNTKSDAMRKILSSIMLVAAAAMASVSCQKEVTAPVNETFSTTMSLNASVEQTKTYLGEDLEGNKTVYWGKDESVNLYVGYKGYVDEEIKDISKFFSSASTDAYNGHETASFIFEINCKDTICKSVSLFSSRTKSLIVFASIILPVFTEYKLQSTFLSSLFSPV